MTNAKHVGDLMSVDIYVQWSLDKANSIGRASQIVLFNQDLKFVYNQITYHCASAGTTSVSFKG